MPRHTASEAGRLSGGTGAVFGLRASPRLDKRGEPHRASRQRARLLAGALCGLGVTLFPGLALLVFQLGLVAAWAFLMLSLLSATTRRS